MIHTLLPAQFGPAATERLAKPQRRLMAAVLQTVVEDFHRSRRVLHAIAPGAGGEDRQSRNAFAYVASRDRVWPFSYENLCEALGLDARHLRTALNTMADHCRESHPSPSIDATTRTDPGQPATSADGMTKKAAG